MISKLRFRQTINVLPDGMLIYRPLTTVLVEEDFDANACKRLH